MVMGHPVDDELLKIVKQTLEDFRKEIDAVSEAVTSLQDQQQSLEGKVEEQEQRLEEMSARHSEQGENYNRLLEIMESLKRQLGQGRYTIYKSFSCKAFYLTLSQSGKEKGLFTCIPWTLTKGSMSLVFFVSPNSLSSVLFAAVVLAFTHYSSLRGTIFPCF